MQVEVKLFGHFRNYLPPSAVNGKTVVALPDGANTMHVFEKLAIPLEVDEGIYVVVANDEEIMLDTPLKDGDKISLFPPLPGG
jgi:molybdopterin converting factor small subunit